MLLTNRYNILQKLGSGGCGEVFLAEDIQLPSKPKCVVKQFKPSAKNVADHQLIKKKFEKEAEILEILGHHDQIPQLYAYFEENGELYIVEQYVQGLTLKQKVDNDGVFDENFVRDFLVCLLPVISFIHSHSIIHRDIKPDNIILRQSDGMPVLIDFGVIKDLEDTVINQQFNQTQIISKGYTSSEQAAGFPVFSSDLFSLGMTVIFMLTGKNPSNLPTTNIGKFAWFTGLPTFDNSTFDWSLDRELTETINKAILDKNDRFKSSEEMLSAVYQGTKRNRPITFHSEMFTPYMWKATEDFASQSYDNPLYIEAIAESSPNSPEFLRYSNWKITNERPVLEIQNCVDKIKDRQIQTNL